MNCEAHSVFHGVVQSFAPLFGDTLVILLKEEVLTTFSELILHLTIFLLFSQVLGKDSFVGLKFQNVLFETVKVNETVKNLDCSWALLVVGLNVIFESLVKIVDLVF